MGCSPRHSVSRTHLRKLHSCQPNRPAERATVNLLLDGAFIFRYTLAIRPALTELPTPGPLPSPSFYIFFPTNRSWKPESDSPATATALPIHGPASSLFRKSVWRDRGHWASIPPCWFQHYKGWGEGDPIVHGKGVKQCVPTTATQTHSFSFHMWHIDTNSILWKTQRKCSPWSF